MLCISIERENKIKLYKSQEFPDNNSKDRSTSNESRDIYHSGNSEGENEVEFVKQQKFDNKRYETEYNNVNLKNKKEMHINPGPGKLLINLYF